MFDDSIEILNYDESVDESDLFQEDKVKFETFSGVGPRRFLDFFSLTLSNGPDLNRKKIIYENTVQTKPRIPTNNLINLMFRLLEECDLIVCNVKNGFIDNINKDIKKFDNIRKKILEN